MPPRKSDVRKSDVRKSDAPAVSAPHFVVDDDDSMAVDPPAADDDAGSSSMPPPPAPGPGSAEKKDKDKEKDATTIEDLGLPKSIITRLAKGVLPANTQIQANAILALSKSATVFVSHLANAANEFTVSANKKTIMPDDVFRALDEVEYGFMREKLEAEFVKFSSTQSTKRSTYRRRVAAEKKAKAGVPGESSMISMASTNADDQTETSMLEHSTAGDDAAQPRAAKKARTEEGNADGASGMDVDGNEPSDAETEDAEPQEEEEDDEAEDEVQDEDGTEEEDEADDPEGGENDLEERQVRDSADEALDDDSE